MNKETIEIIVEFLKRVDLKGSEVPTFNRVQEELVEEYRRNVPEQPQLKQELQEEYFDTEVDQEEVGDDLEEPVTNQENSRKAPTINDLEKRKEIKKIDEHPIEIPEEETSVARNNSYSSSNDFESDPFEKTKEMLKRKK